MEELESMKAASGGLNGGPVFRKAVAAQHHQARQQIAEKLEPCARKCGNLGDCKCDVGAL